MAAPAHSGVMRQLRSWTSPLLLLTLGLILAGCSNGPTREQQEQAAHDRAAAAAERAHQSTKP